MQPSVLELPKNLVVIGYPLRTSPGTAAPDIGAHWGRFLSDHAAARAAGTADDPHIYAVYCDYETDCRGPYTLVLGFAADAATAAPNGLRRVEIPRGPYASFAAHGDPQRVVWEVWSYINNVWADGHRRRYVADFERYDLPSSANTITAQINVGLR